MTAELQSRGSEHMYWRHYDLGTVALLQVQECISTAFWCNSCDFCLRFPGLLGHVFGSGVLIVLCAVWCIYIKVCYLRGGLKDDRGKGQPGI